MIETTGGRCVWWCWGGDTGSEKAGKVWMVVLWKGHRARLTCLCHFERRRSRSREICEHGAGHGEAPKRALRRAHEHGAGYEKARKRNLRRAGGPTDVLGGVGWGRLGAVLYASGDQGARVVYILPLDCSQVVTRRAWQHPRWRRAGVVSAAAGPVSGPRGAGPSRSTRRMAPYTMRSGRRRGAVRAGASICAARRHRRACLCPCLTY